MSSLLRVEKILKPRSKKQIILPLFSNPVPAGFPSPADDLVEEKIDLSAYLIKNPPATYLVRVSGDSMREAGIYSGDLLVVDRSLPVAEGKIVIAAVNGEFTVKRVIKKGQKVYLAPENPRFKPIEVNAESDVEIWGVVTYAVHQTS